MPTTQGESSSPSIATTVAVTLSVAALVLGSALFVGVVGNDDDESATTPAAETVATTSGESTIDFSATWDDAFVARDPSIAPAPTQTVHELEMTATETEVAIAPGVKQIMWTFNDRVPGPTLRGKVGDIFRITLRNNGALPHSIDFHSSKVAWNDEMRSIGPGESIVYEYEAKHAGIFMYHCGTAPALHHIGMGMYGTIVIDPPALPPVDREFVFVQSEIYEAPAGEVAAYEKMLAEDWDAVVFNGLVNQYRDRPIKVAAGERIRAWVMNDGPSENSSFHVVGTIFDTVFKEGAYLLQPGDTRGGAQALDMQPAQGGFVEFTLDEEGLYPIVTHKFANVPKGALGLFQAGDGKSDSPTPVIGKDGKPVTDTTVAGGH
jgi:nitrite reductase (NO-forming)